MMTQKIVSLDVFNLKFFIVLTSLDFKKKVQASFWVKSYSSVDSEIANCLMIA